jgi:hypothetical protein
MKTLNNKKIIGIGLQYLIATILIVSGVLKILKVSFYQKILIELNPNFNEQILLLGTVSLICGILLIIPHTFLLGYISAFVFFGGTIAAHLQHGDTILPQVLFVIVTGVSLYLKKREWFCYRKEMNNLTR